MQTPFFRLWLRLPGAARAYCVLAVPPDTFVAIARRWDEATPPRLEYRIALNSLPPAHGDLPSCQPFLVGPDVNHLSDPFALAGLAAPGPRQAQFVRVNDGPPDPDVVDQVQQLLARLATRAD